MRGHYEGSYRRIRWHSLEQHGRLLLCFYWKILDYYIREFHRTCGADNPVCTPPFLELVLAKEGRANLARCLRAEVYVCNIVYSTRVYGNALVLNSKYCRNFRDSLFSGMNAETAQPAPPITTVASSDVPERFSPVSRKLVERARPGISNFASRQHYIRIEVNVSRLDQRRSSQLTIRRRRAHLPLFVYSRLSCPHPKSGYSTDTTQRQLWTDVVVVYFVSSSVLNPFFLFLFLASHIL